MSEDLISPGYLATTGSPSDLEALKTDSAEPQWEQSMPNVDRLGGTGVLSRKRHMHCQGDGQHTLLWYSERRTGGQSPLTGDMTASAGLGVLRERTRRFCICLSDFYSERRKLPPGPSSAWSVPSSAQET